MPVRVSYDDLPGYRWPILPQGKGVAQYNLIQAREKGRWLTKWLLIDIDGISLARIEADDDVQPAEVAEAALRILQDMHGVSDDETGVTSNVIPLQAVREPPPKD